MLKQSYFLPKACLSLGLMLYALITQAVTPMVIKKETANYLIDIKYPQGFQSAQINSVIKTYIQNMQERFIKELSEESDTPTDAPGKTGLNITYDIPYDANGALSVRFNVSIYYRGAAHPTNRVVVDNFINGHPVRLKDLFIPNVPYLKSIAGVCQQEITKKNISDERWINEGTKPDLDNYNVWYFTRDGVAIVFNSYQVAAYVYGEQTVTLPLAKIKSLIKPEMIKVVWGNQ